MLQRVLRPDDFDVRADAHDDDHYYHHYHDACSDDDHHTGTHDDHYHDRAPINLLRSTTCL